MEDYISTFLALGTILVVLLFFADQVWGLICLVFSTPTRAIVTFVALYAIFFTNVGLYVRPYFTDMSAWGTKDELYEYTFAGTGGFINPNHIVTNHHVIDDCAPLKIRDINGTHQGLVVAIDKLNDLAIIKTSTNKNAYLVFHNKISPPGKELVYPDYTSNAGIFSMNEVTHIDSAKIPEQDRLFADTDSEIFFSGPLRSGNSGSPLLDSKGYLTGIITSGIIRFDPIYIGQPTQAAASLKPLEALLNKHKIQYYKSVTTEQNYLKHSAYTSNVIAGILCAEEL